MKIDSKYFIFWKDLASGSSADWTYDVANIVYSYGGNKFKKIWCILIYFEILIFLNKVELRDQGEYGFLLPPEQIIPSGLETLEAVKALAFYIMQK